MARQRTHRPLAVFVNGRIVGHLRRESTGAIDFAYAQEWLDWDNAFPVSLSLPLREQRYIGAPVVSVFENLLPDSGETRRRVAERVGAGGTDAYSLLAALGRDCVGAMQFLSLDEEPGVVGAIDGRPVSNEDIEAPLANLASAPLGVDRGGNFRISIAGAQEKTALLLYEGRWHKPVGTTATTHILKPQIGRLPHGIDLSNSVENEFLCLRLADAFGVPVAKADIIDFGSMRALAVERFDRIRFTDKRLLRLPQEDCCQALGVPPSRKYQAEGGPGIADIVRLLNGSDRPAEDVGTFLRANLVFWLIGATDGHAKNFSISLTPGGRYRLTPCYDILSSQPAFAGRKITRTQFKLAMSVGTKRHYGVEDIVPRYFMETAQASGVGARAMRAIIDDLAATAPTKAAQVISRLPIQLPDALTVPILTAVERRALLMARL